MNVQQRALMTAMLLGFALGSRVGPSWADEVPALVALAIEDLPADQAPQNIADKKQVVEDREDDRVVPMMRLRPAVAVEVAPVQPKPAGAVQAIFNWFGGRQAAAVGQPSEQTQDVDTLEQSQQLDQFEQQLPEEGKAAKLQFQPHVDRLCREELRFVHAVCHLTRRQFQSIEQDAKHASRKALLKTVQVQIQMQRGWNPRTPPRFPDVQSRLEDVLLVAVQRDLSREQAAAYRHELEARKEFRREAGVESIVASLDSQLIMSTSQREQVAVPIRAAWKDEWQQNVTLLVNGNNYLPRMPLAELKPMLSPEQNVVLDSIRPNGNVFFGQPLGLEFGVQLHNNELPLEEELVFASEASP